MKKLGLFAACLLTALTVFGAGNDYIINNESGGDVVLRTGNPYPGNPATEFRLKTDGTVSVGGVQLVGTSPDGGGTVAVTTAKTFTVLNTLTLAGTDGTTLTFPSTSATIARTDAGNTFTGHQTIEGVTSTGATGTGAFVFATSPTLITPVLGAATGTSVNLSGTATVAKVILPTGAAGTTGTATLTLGTVTVNTTAVTASSKIFLTYENPAGAVVGILSAPSASISAGVHFVIQSADATDSTSSVNWLVIN